MTVGNRRDPYLAFNFRVEIEGLTVARFTEVTGLQVEIEVHDYREGGLNDYIHKLAGPTRYPSNLILKKGLTDVKELWEWHQEVMQGKIERKNVSIVLLNEVGDEIQRWNFAHACPVRWIGPELKAKSGEVAVQTLEMVHRGLM